MNFLGANKKWWFVISGVVILPGILSLIVWGLNLGIDFKGGTIIEYKLTKPVEIKEIKKKLQSENLPGLTLASTGVSSILLKTLPLEKEKISTINQTLKKDFDAQEIRQETVGPVVGKDLKRKAAWSVVLACIGIVLYIAWAFRNIPKPNSSFRFGICAIVALIHDILVAVGSFSIIGHFLHYEVDAYFITALLTILGFSVHDTIVVFDRIRENLKKIPQADFEYVANESIIQTLTRSINTSLTVLFTLFSLFILGGSSIRPFVLTLLIGITTGTYSSIFNATPLLVIWEGRKRIEK